MIYKISPYSLYFKNKDRLKIRVLIFTVVDDEDFHLPFFSEHGPEKACPCSAFSSPWNCTQKILSKTKEAIGQLPFGQLYEASFQNVLQVLKKG